jgi:hypothetical protein
MIEMEREKVGDEIFFLCNFATFIAFYEPLLSTSNARAFFNVVIS